MPRKKGSGGRFDAASSSAMVIEATGPESVLWSGREEANKSVKEQTPGDEDQSSAVGQVGAGNHLDHWSEKMSTTQEGDWVVEVSVAKDTVKSEGAVGGIDHYVQLSEVSTKITKLSWIPMSKESFE